MRTRLAWQTVKLIPTAVQAAIGLTHVAVTTLGALVLVTSLVPVFAVCMAALGTRRPDRGRLSRSPRSAQESD
jgi:energy-converting hydrogenase Eha subunit A